MDGPDLATDFVVVDSVVKPTIIRRWVQECVISGLTILGMREVDGGFKRRTSVDGKSLSSTRVGVWVRRKPGRKHLAITFLTRGLVRAFMTMAHDGKDPTPMQWLYCSRSYGFKIRYTTTAEGKTWEVDDGEDGCRPRNGYTTRNFIFFIFFIFFLKLNIKVWVRIGFEHLKVYSSLALLKNYAVYLFTIVGAL
jgi:hypothetical protein